MYHKQVFAPVRKEKHMNTNDKQLNPYEEYLVKFAKNYNMTVEEAAETAIVKAMHEYFIETGM